MCSDSRPSPARSSSSPPRPAADAPAPPDEPGPSSERRPDPPEAATDGPDAGRPDAPTRPPAPAEPAPGCSCHSPGLGTLGFFDFRLRAIAHHLPTTHPAHATLPMLTHHTYPRRCGEAHILPPRSGMHPLAPRRPVTRDDEIAMAGKPLDAPVRNHGLGVLGRTPRRQRQQRLNVGQSRSIHAARSTPPHSTSASHRLTPHGITSIVQRVRSHVKAIFQMEVRRANVTSITGAAPASPPGPWMPPPGACH